MDRQLQHRSRSRDLRSAAAAEGRDPRSTVDGGRRQRSAKGRDRRRPKAGVGACRASRVRTRAEAAVQVRNGPFDPPLCVSPRVCPSDDVILLPSSAIRHAMAPLRPAQAPCRLRLTATDSAPSPPQDTRVPNSQPPPQMAAQGDCHRRPTTENHSVAVNHGPGPGQRPQRGEPADHTASPNRGQGVEGQTTGTVYQTHGCVTKHDAKVGARRPQRRQRR